MGKIAMQLGMKEFTGAHRVVAPTETGICGGTVILTMAGELPVEALTEGCRVITRDSGMAILKKVTQRTLRSDTVRIKAGSLGHTRPERDMVVMPGTALHVRDWRAEALFGTSAALIEAGRLVDGEYVAKQDTAEVTVYDLVFDRQHILYADGLEIASAAV